MLCTQAVEAMLTRLKEQVREGRVADTAPELDHDGGSGPRGGAATRGEPCTRPRRLVMWWHELSPNRGVGVETLFFDGSLRRGKGHCQEAGGHGVRGAVRKTASGVVVWTAQSRLAQGCTVNEAEYAGLLLCLDELIDHPPVGRGGGVWR